MNKKEKKSIVFEVELSKDEFCDIISNIKKQIEYDEAIDSALQPVCDSYVCYGNSLYHKSLLYLMKKLFNDTEDWISWWLYEDVEKCYFVNKDKFDISTPELFYNFLIENYKSKFKENKKKE